MNFSSSVKGNRDTVIYVSSVHFIDPASILLSYLVFQVAHKNKDMARANFDAHGVTTDLKLKLQ